MMFCSKSGFSVTLIHTPLASKIQSVEMTRDVWGEFSWVWRRETLKSTLVTLEV
jgi:hypothetical protein